jgi:hypothetical protein
MIDFTRRDRRELSGEFEPATQLWLGPRQRSYLREVAAGVCGVVVVGT